MVEIRKTSRTLPNSELFLVRRKHIVTEYFSAAIAYVPLPEISIRAGRPRDFERSTYKTKKPRVQHLLETTCSEELSLAAEIKLRWSGKIDSSAIVEELCRFSPRRETGMLNKGPKTKWLSNDQALALIIDANLSTHQYDIIRKRMEEINELKYPPYHEVETAEQLCYSNQLNVTETHAEVKLQSSMDYTIERLCTVQEEVIDNQLILNEPKHIEEGENEPEHMEEREQQSTEDDDSELKHTENSENEAQHSEEGENLEKCLTKSGNSRKRSKISKNLKQETIIRKREKLLKNHLVLPGCKCEQKCSNNIAEDKRQILNTNFWRLSTKERKAFILNTCNRLEVK
ncbi:hypothetical protein JTB14_017936 [Gonioctena quinquepunctata]|nr:hypothetical protein JTB14_017936 [Gonioctena quinquepunctata]